MSSIVNSVPYIRTSRDFPEDQQALRMELNKAHIDYANAINTRSIGIYPTMRSSICGDEWFISGIKQQSLRQVFTFTSVANITHGLNWDSVAFISPNSYGSFLDTSSPKNWNGCIFASSVAIAGQISFYVTPTQIVIQAGAGAPSVTQGYIVLEWVSVA